jgi:hypothetical protein
MTYSLRRIVCGEEDSHIQLGQRDFLLDVVRDTNMYFKINVANKVSMGRLLITYSPGQIVKRMDGKVNKVKTEGAARNVDLKVCYSAGSIKEP